MHTHHILMEPGSAAALRSVTTSKPHSVKFATLSDKQEIVVYFKKTRMAVIYLNKHFKHGNTCVSLIQRNDNNVRNLHLPIFTELDPHIYVRRAVAARFIDCKKDGPLIL